MSARVLDERSPLSVRQLLGEMLARAREADFAVARIRLGGIDLATGELAGVRRCRVLVGRLDAEALAPAADPGSGRRNLEALLAFLASGRLEVRAAGLETWAPDFSVLRGVAELTGGAGDEGRIEEAGSAVGMGSIDAAVIGAHYFGRPYPASGPAFTCVFHNSSTTELLTGRFEELWARGYDVAGVVRQALERLLGAGAGQP